MRQVVLPAFGTFAVWRDAARALAGAGIPAEEVSFTRDATPGLLGQEHPLPPSQRQLRVPRAFLDLAEAVSCHRDATAHDRLYALLLRLQDAPGLLGDRADPMVDGARRMEKSVRRDIHKMHAFLRFRALPEEEGRLRFAAWFEPQHFITERAVPFFAERHAQMDFLIATPEMTAFWQGGRLTFGPPSPRPDLPPDGAEALWHTYFVSIFNPARLKVKAMTAEMPRRYWKNLPETSLIPGMIADAPRRTAEMRGALPTMPPAHALRLAAARSPSPPELSADLPPLAEARRQAAVCTRCDLCHNATQTVFGEGPADAGLMIVGEQPGDQEDLAGRPFVGPAGQLFDRVAQEVGLSREQAWITNAVKHFKFLPRGKRRLHQRPNGGEIMACRWWLDIERARLRPRLIVGMGATAAEALTGNGKGLTQRRGKFERDTTGAPLLLTWHPSYLLRVPEPEMRLAAERQFRSDLATALDFLRDAA
ncbi:uracil-DNA glycosylase [Haematobacter massiliensis]|uniref:Type-4 uracil-DNA glycosylase n=1 Tax=Haematobacter massiliensis TaxID=195105 RepID=A0A086Y8N4_9RHOB|nr:UdgX family uracil-DNA binding protein [Haematobacter massiliensis]KFI30634.1 DNA polymerase [Haematobacter massiliensis]OWJ71523.1 uracil-DNA glycosylase [Haematobacter massiliensis]OWJ83453.1 uracil-DNA glycosylase [Haematobacter massiliensis]QBJ25100.1 DUF4130 domain-containing protein [Haematobacter massiliensis]